MVKGKSLPSITGKKLIKLLREDGWDPKRRSRHGIALAKKFQDKTRVTVVPDKNTPLAKGTLGGILGPQQTNLGRHGLLRLLSKYG